MNRLKQLMFTYGISSYRLSKMTGMSACNIRRLCTGDAINNAHIKTLTTLGDVFGISPLEVKGDDPRAITDPLEARVRLKVYELANLLREYGKENTVMRVNITTRDPDDALFRDFISIVTYDNEGNKTLDECGNLIRDQRDNIRYTDWVARKRGGNGHA